MKNAFGLEIYEIKELLKERQVESTIHSMLFPVLRYIGITDEKSNQIVKECLEIAKTYTKMYDYEKMAHEILKREGVVEGIAGRLSVRAEIIYKQIKPFILQGNVFDFGCGDGRVGGLLSKDGLEVALGDIYEHKHVKETRLRFRLFGANEKIPFSNSEFDNTLALTVYHHSNFPIHTIKESCRVTKPNGRVIAIESVYGVRGESLPEKERERIRFYLGLDREQQSKVNTFFDHFYNRIIHYSDDPKKKVTVPFNFSTPGKWKDVFLKHGLEQENMIHLGIDQPAVPEYHTLHILRKI